MKSNSSVSESLPDEEEEEEIWAQEDFPFSNNLKDLQNLRMQLYAAAEYFELSYANDDQKQIMIETLKDYAIKAIVNTVDHLGSVAYKVNGFVDEKVDEASATELQVNSIEQRLKTCQTHSELEGLRQQSLVMNSPRYHKRYVLPDEFLIPWKAIPTTVKSLPSSLVRKERPPSPSRRSYSKEGDLHKEPEKKRTVSPCRFPLPRSGSLPNRPSTTNPIQPANPTLFRGTQQNSTELWKSASVHVDHGKESFKEPEQPPRKSNSLIRALLKKRKPIRNDEMLYTYLDKYS
ncbi:protein ABIL3-like isoform X2 [Impatiens glandulifera]|uniref:protein ABIL3-like isoform X2 n=1 Tax=Impatiens glandulifera TaxID=253017 RepID=UPI001FB13653|nr:protein ABIL3-like isoform X2 [Impatiens glandulifera]